MQTRELIELAEAARTAARETMARCALARVEAQEVRHRARQMRAASVQAVAAVIGHSHAPLRWKAGDSEVG